MKDTIPGVKVNIQKLCSCNGIQTFAVDLVSDLLIGQHWILFLTEIALVK